MCVKREAEIIKSPTCRYYSPTIYCWTPKMCSWVSKCGVGGGKGSPPLIPKCPLLYIFTIKHLKKLTFDRMMLCLTLLRLTEAWHFCHIVLSSVILLLRISDRDRSCVRHGSTRLIFDIVESRMHKDFAGNLTFVKEYREARLFVLASVDTEHRN